jgi:hypothetical protein
MKSKFITFILILLTIVLLGGIVFFAWAIYNDLFYAEAVETVHTSDNTIIVDNGSQRTNSKEKSSFGDTIVSFFTNSDENNITYSSSNSSGKYFYEQLNETQKVIYNGLQENKDKLVSGTHKIEFGNQFYDVLSKENGSEVLGDDYQAAIEAFTHDNADLFYINVSKMYLNMETKKKAFKTTYNVFIAPEEGSNYFAKGFSSEADVKLAMQKIEQEKNIVKSKLTGNTYKDIKIIHDYLVNNISYDEDYKSIGTYSIYGALVDKRCVCEGYTRAFKYLADMAGINCVLIQGTATNTEGKTEKHAWNAVYLNGFWYLIDTTWDDPIIVGRGIVLANTHYKYFLKGSKTFSKDHVEERQFSEGGKQFEYPKISEQDY